MENILPAETFFNSLPTEERKICFHWRELKNVSAFGVYRKMFE